MSNYKVKANTKSMTKDEYFEFKKNGITGSDAPKVACESRFGGPINVWLEKTNPEIKPEPMSEAGYFGELLEDLIAKEFERRTGKVVRRSNAVYENIEHPFMLARIDRNIVGEEAFLECMTTSAYDKNWVNEDLTADIYVKVQHTMAVMGYDYCYVAALLGSREFHWFRVDRNQEIIDELIETETRFWYDYVLPKAEPPLDGSDFSKEYVNDKYPAAEKGKKIKLDESWIPEVQRRQEIADQIDVLEKAKTEIDNRIKAEMGDADKALCGEFTINWINCKKTSFDKTKVAPEIYEAACKTTTYRRFEVK